MMCPGDTDWCPHNGCTTCQGEIYYFKDPDNGAGYIPDGDRSGWDKFIKESKAEEAKNLAPDSEWRYKNWGYDG